MSGLIPSPLTGEGEGEGEFQIISGSEISYHHTKYSKMAMVVSKYNA
jgi:hypothetical protein